MTSEEAKLRGRQTLRNLRDDELHGSQLPRKMTSHDYTKKVNIKENATATSHEANSQFLKCNWYRVSNKKPP